jgi:hypothetical protein
MNQTQKYSIHSRNEYLMTRNKEVSRLRDSIIYNSNERIQEYVNAIINAYEKSTEVRKIATYKEEKSISSLGFRSIGLYQSIDKANLFDKTYYWLPFFSDVGRTISRGERRNIHDKLGKHVSGAEDTISFSNPDFSVLNKYVIHLRKKGFKPNMMLAPIQIYSSFVKHYKSKLAVSGYNTDNINLEECDIQIAWSHRYAPLRSFVIYDSSMGIWHAIHDIDSGKGITAAIGKSKDDENKMLFFVETMAYYEILNKNAFTRINISH